MAAKSSLEDCRGHADAAQRALKILEWRMARPAGDAVKMIASFAKPRALDSDEIEGLIKGFGAMAEAGFHGAQLERMSDGKEPNAQLSPFRATTHYLGAQMAGFVRLMRRPALPKQLVAQA